jgi:FAD/FMN-containing dehydrogenase
MKSVGMGQRFHRGDAGFEAAVLGTSFNARDPGRRPDLVFQANDASDVTAALALAAERGWRVGICSGGHSWAQNHIRQGGMMLDLSRLNSIRIDKGAMRAVVGPGTHCGVLAERLAKQGLFFPVAHAATVGIGGFLLQGGFGWNSRAVGMACENVVGIDVVLADGRQVHASETENPELFWAARGSGPGFFGVVTAFHLKLYAKPGAVGLKVQVFRMKHLEAVMRWADSAGPSVSPKVEFQMVFNRKAMGIFAHGIEVIAPVLAGSWAEAKAATRFIDDSPIRRLASFTLPLLPLSLPFMMKTGEKTLFLPDTRWNADNMWMDCPIEPLLPGLRAIADSQPPAPSHVLWLNWNAPASRPDMAFSVEARTYLALYGGVRGEADDAEHRDWATSHMTALAPWSQGIQLADENLARRPACFVSVANLARLDAARATYDPEGRFWPWMGRPA